MKTIEIGNIKIGENQPLCFLSGPCVIESEEHAFSSAQQLKEIFAPFPFSFIFKASYDKANRTSLHSFRGPGLKKGLSILEKIKKELDLPIVTDVHTPEEAKEASLICDLIQIPAFLSRQTDLLVAAATHAKAVTVKKGQFAAPWDMAFVIEKLVESGAKNILLTDRGVSFGYNNLISDMRAIPIMQKLGFPVCFDASHSVQMPGGQGSSSAGNREWIPTLAKAAVAAGANAIFLETHPQPDLAKSDKATVFPFQELPSLLKVLEKIYNVVHV